MPKPMEENMVVPMQDGEINKEVQIMRFNPSNVANGLVKGVSFVASLSLCTAIALTAAVHIKHCIHDLLPKKKHSGRVEIHVYEAEEREEQKGNNPDASNPQEVPGDADLQKETK